MLFRSHTPSGLLRGGKYSSFEAGTRVPTIVKWAGHITGGKISDALVCQIDLLTSLAKLAQYHLPSELQLDASMQLNAWIGKDKIGRSYLIEQGMVPNAIVKGVWKYIQPTKGLSVSRYTNIELANRAEPQLYNLKSDPGEKNNLANTYPEILKSLSELLTKETSSYIRNL